MMTLIIICYYITRILQCAVFFYCALAILFKPYDKGYKIIVWMSKFMDPLLRPFRKLCDPLTQKVGIDISPVISMMVFQIIYRMIIYICYFIGRYVI